MRLGKGDTGRGKRAGCVGWKRVGCGGERGTWEHIWEECRDWGGGRESWQQMVGWALEEEEEGEWMRKMKKERGGEIEGGERGENKKGVKGGGRESV